MIAISGLPPFGVFMSEFLVLSSTFARQPLLALGLCSGSCSRSARCCCGYQRCFRRTLAAARLRSEASYVPLFAHLSLVLIAGIYLPAPLIVWFQHVARLLG